MTAVWLFLRAEARHRWRAWLSLALIVGVISGGVLTAATGALRTGSAFDRFLEWSRPPDSVVFAEPYDPNFDRLSPTAVTLRSGGRLEARTIVIAAGPWSGEVAALCGIALPVEPRRRSVFVFDVREQRAQFPSIPDHALDKHTRRGRALGRDAAVRAQ